MPYTVKDRFLRYVQIDTTADPEGAGFPSSEKQKDLSRILLQELLAMGLVAEMDEWGYVFGTIPATISNKVPIVCFCSHVDTAPDVTGTNVKPIVHQQYDGKPIVLPDDPTQRITTARYPYLAKKLGDDIITASGTTLLGADDKSGVAIIMDLAHQLVTNPEIPHGEIRILFTPDEEIGKGVDKLDMKKLNADFGYTLDGGPLGDFEDETFSADGMTLTFHGVSAHPGYAKGKMVNAIKLAAEFINTLPKDHWSPETTAHREGFVHPHTVQGGLEKAVVNFIIRDHDTRKLKDYEARLHHLAEEVVAQYPGARLEVAITEQYRNMKEILNQYPFVAEYALQAIAKAGLTPKHDIIRGGTDGSRLSFMGLPCPNIFTGMMAIHSKHEFISVQDMEKAVDTLVELVQIWGAHKGK
ncbi:MAG: peptidase T [Schleiferiaceae bacterium]|nr:peptidase T [Schleiferiaceae bacterium]